MNLYQVVVISKLFYGSSRWDLRLSCSNEQLVNEMMQEDLERFRACEKISNETGVHNDHDRFSDFMQC